ncbi:MAG: uL13 family ribosomal protein [Candidatus Yonathbacteria bacterium]|nr:uL13 family ribosomal protein [Candidatus Yonathbacteria bacterium]
MTNQLYKIDAEGKSVGRIASLAAHILMGKTSPSFQKNLVADVQVVINNASKASIAQKKFNEIRAKTYSGYPGGLKESTLAHLIEKKEFGEVFIHAIERMIPRNRLHKGRMKRLVVNE